MISYQAPAVLARERGVEEGEGGGERDRESGREREREAGVGREGSPFFRISRNAHIVDGDKHQIKNDPYIGTIIMFSGLVFESDGGFVQQKCKSQVTTSSKTLQIVNNRYCKTVNRMFRMEI